jgi:hypothetical protein
MLPATLLTRRQQRGPQRTAALLLLWLALACAVGCGAGTPARAIPEDQALPAYDSAARSLLDDGMAAQIFGLSTGDDAMRNNDVVRRTAASQAVVVARVATITRNTTDNSLAYELVLSPFGAPLMGNWTEGPIYLEVSQKNPAFPLVDSTGTELTGRRVILFLRMYDQDGRATLHFHAEPDTPAMLKAVQNARALHAFGL